ncbi:MAG: V-type ATP synthase subunit F [bacterium]|nr:V-type ATP synthase subunit F [bacterium]
MSKIAFIGEQPSILGFKAIGADIFPAADGNEAVNMLENMFKEDYKIIYITENIAGQITDYLKGIDRLWPIITIIPGFKGSKGLGKARLRNYIIKATGTDMIS